MIEQLLSPVAGILLGMVVGVLLVVVLVVGMVVVFFSPWRYGDVVE